MFNVQQHLASNKKDVKNRKPIDCVADAPSNNTSVGVARARSGVGGGKEAVNYEHQTREGEIAESKTCDTKDKYHTANANGKQKLRIPVAWGDLASEQKEHYI